MLWLIGLMGIAGAGAASIVPTSTDADQPDDETDTFEPEPEDYNGDLLDQIEGVPVGMSTQLDTLLTDLDTLGEQVDNAFPAGLTGFGLADDVYDTPPVDDGIEGEDVTYTEAVQEPLILAGASAVETLKLGDWITEGEPAEIMEYDARKDSLVLVWDDLEGPVKEPDVRVETDPFDDEVRHVVMNDTSVAEIYGDPGLSAGDITMIPLSSALIVGLEPA